MKHIYKCDACGAEFDTELACHNHELACNRPKGLRAVYLDYDREYQQFSFQKGFPFTGIYAPGGSIKSVQWINQMIWKINVLDKPKCIDKARLLLRNVAQHDIEQMVKAIKEVET